MRSAVLAAAALLSASLAAQADTVFNIDATLQSGTVTGTLTLNATSTAFSAIDLHFVDGNLDVFYTTIQAQGQQPSYYGIDSLGVQNNIGPSFFDVNLDVTSLAGYTGSALCSDSARCDVAGGGSTQSGYGDLQPFFSDVVIGSLDLVPPASAITPEPASFALLGTGLFGLAGVFRRRMARS